MSLNREHILYYIVSYHVSYIYSISYIISYISYSISCIMYRIVSYHSASYHISCNHIVSYHIVYIVSNLIIYISYHIVLYYIVCVTTGPQPLPNRVLHRVRSSSSSLILQCPLFLMAIQYLLTSSSSSSRRFCSYFYLSFHNVLYIILHYIVYVYCSPTYNTLLCPIILQLAVNGYNG